MDGSEVQVLGVRLFSAQQISPASAFSTPVLCVFLTDFCCLRVLNSQGRGDLQPRRSFSCRFPSSARAQHCRRGLWRYCSRWSASRSFPWTRRCSCSEGHSQIIFMDHLGALDWVFP